MIKVACFDLGGVLIKIAHHWEDAAAHAKMKITEKLPLGRPLNIAPGFDDYQAGRISDSEYVAQLARFLDVTEDQAQSIHNHILLEPYEGVHEIVMGLDKLGIETACLSNTNSPHWRYMSDSGRFPTHLALGHRFASHELRLQKPDPEIFLAFESALGSRGAQIAFFDDSQANVEAAARLGWNAFKIDPSKPTASQILNAFAGLGIQLYPSQ
jgi:FMN phosphatase YigB (HAD superfamily)